MVKKLALVLSIALMATALFTSSGFASTTIKIGHVLNTDHSWHRNLTGFANEVKKETDGRVVIQLYPSGQLGNEKDMVEGLTFGTVDGGLIGGGSFQSIDPKFGIEALPYAWPTHEAAYKAFDGKLGKYLFDLLGQKGIVGLAWWENGFRHITNNKKPIVKPEDLKGLKIRTMENPMHIAFFKELGANPTPMSWGELYTALQQGTVDAEENPYAMIDDGKFYEVQKYVSETGHVFSYEILIANKKFMDKLPADLRKVVVDAAHKAIMTQRASLEKEEAAFKAKVTKAGLTANELTPEQKKPFVDATKKVYAQFENELGKEIMDIARKVQK